MRFEFSDYYGISRCKIIPARHFVSKASNGIGIALCHLSQSIDEKDLHIEAAYGKGEIGSGDAVWFPDFDTFRILPWYRKTASIILEPTYYKDQPVTCYPRYIARKQLARLEGLGMSLFSAQEQECYVVDKNTNKLYADDVCIRSSVRTYADPNLLDQLVTNLYKVGLDVENCELEGGQGQLEINYKPAFGIQAADNAYFFKASVKEIAQQCGYKATFMSKPYADKIGSSAHLNHSIWDLEGKVNLLYDSSAENKLSKVGQHWIAGILKHAPALIMLMAPTVNCYKRFRHVSHIGAKPNWGVDNRCCMLRLKVNGPEGTYIENRSSGGSSNPYLITAGIVAAGIDGIERQLPLPEQEAENPSKMLSGDNSLPHNLSDAMKAFEADEVIKTAFGDDFLSIFKSVKGYEINAMKAAQNGDESDGCEWDRTMFFNSL